MTDPAEIKRPSAQEAMRRALLEGSAAKESAVYIVPRQVRALEAANFAIADLSTHVIVPRDGLTDVLQQLVAGNGKEAGLMLRAMINHKDNAP